MPSKVYYQYLSFDGADLFTVICLPDNYDKYPTLIYRKPYVDADEMLSEEEICIKTAADYATWLDHGYAVVFQH